MLYLETEIGPKREGREAAKATLTIGAYIGITEATPEHTGRVTLGMTF